MAALTKHQATELQRLESIIEEGIKTFVEVGSALLEIRKQELYLPHETFEEYCKARWSIGKSHANRLMQASEIVGNLRQDLSGTSPIGEVCDKDGSKLPETETQARPLAKLPREEQTPAWKEAVETAPNGKVTAAHVETIVQSRAERLGLNAKPTPPKIEPNTEESLVEESKPESREDEIKRINSVIESYCRRLWAMIDEIPEDVWLSDMGRNEGARQKIKDACGTLRTAKCHCVCPICQGSGEGCKPCIGSGRMPKVNYDRSV